MLAAVQQGEALAARALPLDAHALPGLQKLAAALAWQDERSAAQLAEAVVPRARAGEVVVVSCRAVAGDEAHGPPRVLVAPREWLARPEHAGVESAAVLAYPMGSAENRPARRRAEIRRRAELVDDFDVLLARFTTRGAPRAGDLLARPMPSGAIRVEAVR
jgi:hypothetical protein